MALNASGPISLAGTTAGQSIEIENNGNGTTQISLNDTAVRTLAGVTTPGSTITMPTDFYGKSNTQFLTITSTLQELNLRSWALSNGWNGTSNVVITLGSGIYIYSNNTAVPALTIDGSWPNGVTLVNTGFIIGKGGDTAANGGPAISLGVSCTINNTNASAYIGGGGGGGGHAPYGGGGAGGGNGNPTVGTNGPNGAVGSTGGGGGRIIPGSGAGAVSNNTAGVGGGAGGSGTAYGRSVTISFTHQTFIGSQCAYAANYSPRGDYGGGGGGWGASGGAGKVSTGTTNGTSGAGGSGNAAGGNASASGGSFTGGGAGGKAVNLNGYSVTWVGGDTSRVYGAIS